MPPNSQGSNVNTAPSSFNLNAIQNGLGAARRGYNSFDNLSRGNYLTGTLQAASMIPYFQQQFPQTFDPATYKNPTSSQVVNGINIAGRYAQPGLDAIGLYGNLQNGNYGGAISNAQSLTTFGQQQGFIPDTNQMIQSNTGLKPADYKDAQGNQVSGYAPYLGAGVGGYQAIRDFQQGNYFGAGVNALQAGNSAAQIYNSYFPAAANLGSNAAAGAAGGGSAGAGGAAESGSALGTLGEVAGYAGLAYSAYNAGKVLFDGDLSAEEKAKQATIQSQNAAAAYATAGISSLVQFADNKFTGGQIGKLQGKAYDFQGSTAGAILNPAGFAVQKGFEKALKLTGSKKGSYQQARDQYRTIAREQGILDENNTLTLADGSTFDAGADGSKLKYGDVAKQEGAGEAIASADALTAGLGFQGKQREGVSLLFAKAALSKGDVNANLKAIAEKHGLSGDQIQQSLDKQLADGKIKQEQYDVWSSKNQQVFGGKGPTTPPAAKNPGEIVGDIPKPTAAPSSGNYDQYIKDNNIKPGESFRVPGDPNRYTITEDGSVRGTLIGFDRSRVDLSKPPERITGNEQFLGAGPSKGPGPGQYLGADGKVHNRVLGQQIPTHGKIAANIISGKPPSQGLLRDDIRQVFSSTARRERTYRGG